MHAFLQQFMFKWNVDHRRAARLEFDWRIYDNGLIDAALQVCTRVVGSTTAAPLFHDERRDARDTTAAGGCWLPSGDGAVARRCEGAVTVEGVAAAQRWDGAAAATGEEDEGELRYTVMCSCSGALRVPSHSTVRHM